MRDPMGARIAALRVFENAPDDRKTGSVRELHNAEIAQRLGISLILVEKRWKFAKGYLLAKLSPTDS